jgi:hypothetical protein
LLVLARGAWRVVVIVAIAGIALGCSDQDPTGMPESSDRAGIALAVAPTMGQTISPRLSNTDITPSSVGTYPEWTVVEIKVAGLLNRYFSDAPIWGSLAGKPFGQWDAGGVQAGGSSCIGNVWIAFDSPGFVGFCDNPSTALRSDWRAVRMVRGEGKVGWVSGPHRTDGTCDTPSTPPCFTYLLDHTVTITPFPAELVLKANKAAIESGQNVTFTASVTPDTIENVGVPFKVVEWQWLPDAGGAGAVLTHCENQKVCTYAPNVSGTMRATGFANGAAAEAEVHVTVLDCLTGDSLLDDPGVRDLLRQVYNGMGIGGPDSLRTERAAGMYCDATGACTSELYPVGPNDNECSMYPPAAADSSDILIHGHPFRPRSEFPNPQHCVIDGIPYGLPPEARPSNHDFVNYAGPRILIVIDRTNVYVVPRTPDGLAPPPGPDGSYSGQYSKRRWSGLGDVCDVTKPPIT